MHPKKHLAGKKLKTSLGIAKRMVKEVNAYEKEVEQNEAGPKMRDGETYDIKQKRFDYMMVPDSKSRLETALGDLEAAIADAEELRT